MTTEVINLEYMKIGVTLIKYGECPIPIEFQGKAGPGPGKCDLVAVSLLTAEELDWLLKVSANFEDSLILLSLRLQSWVLQSRKKSSV